MRNYQDYSNQTLSGMHGSTAQYWMVYIKLVHLYLMMIRACKMASLDLFIYTLREMTNIVFACSRPNYSRWMVRYSLNLANINTTHPGMKELFGERSIIHPSYQQTVLRDTSRYDSGTDCQCRRSFQTNRDCSLHH